MTTRGDLLTQARLIERLRAIRDAQGMTQDELAAGAGLTHQQVSQVELGKRSLSLAEYVALCRALRVDARDVLTDEPLAVQWV